METTLAQVRPSDPLLPFLEGGEGERGDASCHQRRCQGRREISRWHSGIVPLKYKHTVLGNGILPLLPLHPAPYAVRVSPTSSQYGLFLSRRRCYVFLRLALPMLPSVSGALPYHPPERTAFPLQSEAVQLLRAYDSYGVFIMILTVRALESKSLLGCTMVTV